MKKIVPCIIMALFSALTSKAQVGIGTLTPHVSAQLEILSNTKGLLIPRMTATERMAIAGPAAGLLVYQTDNINGFYFFSNGQWLRLATSAEIIAGGGGNKFLSGNINPGVAIGADGDFYLNTTTSTLFGPKAMNNWPASGTLLIGPQGPQGMAGAVGPTGPAGTGGATGPQGIQGIPGATGPAGADGAIGPQGMQGMTGAIGPAGPMGATGPQGPAGAGSASVNGTVNYVAKFINTTTVGNSTLQDDGATVSTNAENGFLATGTFDEGTIPVEGAGVRMMWYPKKAAFRAGGVVTTEWNDLNIGIFSTAMGGNSTARGDYSTAMGNNTTANSQASIAMGRGSSANGGEASIAMGINAQANSEAAIAMGNSTLAIGPAAIAMGNSTFANGPAAIAIGNDAVANALNSTAIGYSTFANGEYSTAIGNQTTAGGFSSTAMGYRTAAGGEYSTAIGNFVSTNNKTGSFIIGDLNDNGVSAFTNNDASNQMMMRFKGGYKLFTAVDIVGAGTIGAEIVAGGNSWVTISDKRKKENFEPVNGEDFLRKIAGFKLSSWNYKGQDAKTFRHYGPMAQDMFAAFGKDSFGIIGNDTTINQADFDGINLVAIQALEKRTTEFKAETEKLKAESNVLRAESVKQKAENAALKQELLAQKTEFASRLAQIEARLSKDYALAEINSKSKPAKPKKR
ncbi:MAG: tail fiber domain-containing protein [Daejeonella sp.]